LVALTDSAPDAIGGVPDIQLCTAGEVELKGLLGSHNLYAVGRPVFR
jgi:hypothetical protein